MQSLFIITNVLEFNCSFLLFDKVVIVWELSMSLFTIYGLTRTMFVIMSCPLTESVVDRSCHSGYFNGRTQECMSYQRLDCSEVMLVYSWTPFGSNSISYFDCRGDLAFCRVMRKFVSVFKKVGGFIRVLVSVPTILLTCMIYKE